MPRNITVTFDDGSQHVYQNAPDDVTPEEVTTRAQQEYGKGVKALDGGRPAKEKSFLESAGDTLKNVGTGFLKGLSSLAVGAGDVMANDPQIREAVAVSARKRGVIPESIAPKFGELGDKVAGMGYQPQTPKEKLINAIAAGAGGALTSPAGGIGPLRAMGIGGTAGLGSEAASQISGGNPAAAIAGGLAGGGVAGALSSIRGNTRSLAQEALRDVKPEDLALAQARQEEARALGIPINLSQAMPTPSNIDTIVDTLANSRYGTKVTKQLRNQPSQVAIGMEDQLAKLPGDIRAPQTVANNMQDVTTKVIDTAKKARAKAWLDEYNKGVLDLKAKAMGQTENVTTTSPVLVDEAGNPLKVTKAVDAVDTVGTMPEASVKAAYDKLGTLAAERPNTGLSDMLLDLRAKLKSGDRFITDGEQINGILKDVTARLKSPDLASKGVDAGGVKFMGNTINDLREGFGEKFTPFQNANQVFADTTENIINPLKKSVVGDLAGKRGSLPDQEAVKSRITSIFRQGTVPGAKSSEILSLEKAIRNVPATADNVSGPAAFQDAAKTWMASEISAAAKQTGDRVADNIAANLESTFMGNDTKAQGFRDTLVALARSQGKPDSTYVKGMENFFKTVSAASRRPGSVGGVGSGGVAEVAGKTVATPNGNTIINPFRNILARWSERLQADAYSEIDRLLTSPEGVATLKQLAKQPPMSAAAQNTISTYLGTQATVGDDMTQPYPK